MATFHTWIVHIDHRAILFPSKKKESNQNMFSPVVCCRNSFLSFSLVRKLFWIISSSHIRFGSVSKNFPIFAVAEAHREKERERGKLRFSWLTKWHVSKMMGSNRSDIPYLFRPFRWQRIRTVIQWRQADLQLNELENVNGNRLLCCFVVPISNLFHVDFDWKIRKRGKIVERDTFLSLSHSLITLLSLHQRHMHRQIPHLHITCSSNELCNGFSNSFCITMLSASHRKFTPFSKRVAVNDSWLYVVNVKSFSSS